jgi:hypothetical protein
VVVVADMQMDLITQLVMAEMVDQAEVVQVNFLHLEVLQLKETLAVQQVTVMQVVQDREYLHLLVR